MNLHSCHMREGMKNLRDSITNKIYLSHFSWTLARGIFMSKPATGLFPCPGISRSSHLSCLVLSRFSRSLGGLFLLCPTHITLERSRACFLLLSTQIQSLFLKIPCLWSSNWNLLSIAWPLSQRNFNTTIKLITVFILIIKTI